MHYLIRGFSQSGAQIVRMRIFAASATTEAIQADALSMLEDYGRPAVTAKVDQVCPKCEGIPENPDMEGCEGCMACDFHGTLAGYESMQALERALKAPPCTECGATTAEEAETKCTCGGDKDSCHGCTIWPA